MAADPETDFDGYMENLQQYEKQQQEAQKMMADHENWRQTTWTGWGVRQLQAIGNHFSPFFLALEQAMSSEDSSPVQILIMATIRALLIAAFIVAVYALSSIFSSILGKEIVIEQEVIVEDEDEQGGDETRTEEKQNAPSRSSTRGKKKRQ